MAYKEVKSKYIRKLIKKLRWKDHYYVDNLVRIEELIIKGMHAKELDFQYTVFRLKYLREWKAICRELDPERFSREWAELKKEIDIQRKADRYLDLLGREENKKKKKEWLEMGGRL